MSGGTRKSTSQNILPDIVFKLRPERLQVGDVLASTVPDDSFSKAIRFYTGGAFSHVAIIHSPNMLCEAADFGVLDSSTHRIFAADKSSLAVFRPKPEKIDFSSSPQKENLLSSACREMWLVHYGMNKAIGVALFPFRLIARKDEYFCSELVARAYANCGIELCPGVKPEKTTPKMVYESKIFFRVDHDDLFEAIPLPVAKSVYCIDSTLDLPTEESHQSLLQGISIAIQETRGNKPSPEEEKLHGLSVAELEGWNDRIENMLASWVTNHQLRRLLVEQHIQKGYGQFSLKHAKEQYQFAVYSFDRTKKLVIDTWALKGSPDKLPHKKRMVLREFQRSLGLQTISMLLQLESVEQLKDRLSLPPTMPSA